MIIDLYPECEKPEWIKIGVWCYCLGEGNDKFVIDTVERYTAILSDGRYCHGRESFSKLYQDIDGLKTRRGRKD